MSSKNSGTTIFIIFVAIAGLVTGGLVLASPPKSNTSSNTTSQQPSVGNDPSLINRDDAPILGKKDAPVKIVVFSDYLCPYCKQIHTTIDQLLGDYNDQIAVEYRNFVVHQDSQIMAQAAYAAAQQGKFKEAADAIFNQYNTGSEDEMLKMAKSLELDTNKFKSDIESDSAKDYVAKDDDDAQSLNLGGTPSLFVNNQYLEDNATLGAKIKEILGK